MFCSSLPTGILSMLQEIPVYARESNQIKFSGSQKSNKDRKVGGTVEGRGSVGVGAKVLEVTNDQNIFTYEVSQGSKEFLKSIAGCGGI